MIIKTERLEITEMKAEDWPDLLEIFQDFEASPYAQFDYPLPLEEAGVQQLADRWAKTGLFFAVRLHGKTEMIGYICFHNDDGAYDIGYNFKSKEQGKGYAYEAASAMLQTMRAERGITYFTAGLALGNRPSRRLAEKLGFVLAGTETRTFRKDTAGQGISCECGNFELFS